MRRHMHVRRMYSININVVQQSLRIHVPDENLIVWKVLGKSHVPEAALLRNNRCL